MKTLLIIISTVLCINSASGDKVIDGKERSIWSIFRFKTSEPGTNEVLKQKYVITLDGNITYWDRDGRKIRTVLYGNGKAVYSLE